MADQNAPLDFSSQGTSVSDDELAGNQQSPVADFSGAGTRTVSTKGNLTPEQDQRAREKAQRIIDYTINNGFLLGDSEIGKRLRSTDRVMQDSISAGVGQKISGLLNSEALGGEGREFGEAVDQYVMEYARENAYAPGLTSFLGSILTPSPTSKVQGAKGLISGIGEAAVMSGAEEANRQLPSEANLEDVGKATGIGGVTAGVLAGGGRVLEGTGAPSGVGRQLSQQELRGKNIKQAAEIARGDLNIGQTPSMKGNEFADTLRSEADNLEKRGKDLINEATSKGNELDRAASKATAAGSGQPAMRLQYTLRGPEYQNLRKVKGGDTIPITKEGTPSAFELRSKVDELATSAGDTMSIKDVDVLRTQIRGLRSRAANATDEAALNDMEEVLEASIQRMVDEGYLVGDPNSWSLYKEGRKLISDRKNLTDSTRLNNILKDESIPGSSIANEFFKLQTPAQRKRAAKAIADVAKSLGKGSESYASLQAGMLTELFSSTDPKVLLRNMKLFEEDPELISQLFSPQVSNKLTELAVSLENMDLSVPRNANRISEQVTAVIDFAAQSVAGNTKLGRGLAGLANAGRRPSVGMSIATGASTGSPVAAGAALVGTEILAQLAKAPVRAAIGKAAQATAIGAARQTAVEQDSSKRSQGNMQPYIPDEQIIQDTLPNVLEGN